METRTILLLLGVLAAAAAFADTWTWTDEEGVVHYSDRPHPGATRIAIDEPNTSVSPAPTRSSSATDESGEEETPGPFRYESFEVASPGPEETLWNIASVLNVSLALNPALQPGHQIRVYFDGTPQIVSSTSFQLEEVYRGVHNLQAEVLDETGSMMIRTRTNRFYVQQTTVR
jgi:hypothetical protein